MSGRGGDEDEDPFAGVGEDADEDADEFEFVGEDADEDDDPFAVVGEDADEPADPFAGIGEDRGDDRTESRDPFADVDDDRRGNDPGDPDDPFAGVGEGGGRSDDQFSTDGTDSGTDPGGSPPSRTPPGRDDRGGGRDDGGVEQATLPEENVIAGETIVVAGAKGGSGKTTVSLGLAGAFSRSNREAVVVDADRQLPNLHVMAGLDREPTLSDLGRGTEVRDVLQRRPDDPDVGIIAAPRVDEPVDIRSRLERLEVGDRQLLVDCPSGFGPAAVDPLVAADAAVVVTTRSDRSVAAAERTIEVAERLGTPVRGAIVSRSQRVPDEIQSRLEVPVLGAVPEVGSENPLTAPPVRDAFDEVLYCIETEYSVRMDSALGFDR